MNKYTSIDHHLLFRSLLDAVPIPTLVIDRERIIRYANKAAQTFYSKQGLTAITPDLSFDLFIHDHGIVQLVQKSIQTTLPQQSKYVRGEIEIPWQILVSPLATHAQETPTSLPQEYHYFAITIEDQAAVRRAERAQRDFIANISHELRTPLTSVRLLAETLEDAIDTDPEVAQGFVEKIEVEVQYLTDLVNELLELSSLESGHVLMNIEPLEAEQLVREVMARMLPLAQRHRVVLRTEIVQGQTLVAADSKQITRVLVNLVHNAIKFTPSGGVIVIGTNPFSHHSLQQFFVRDTGVGIHADELPRIFERFYKTNRARTKNDYIGPGGGGTGLGLAIARHVIESHGGRISAKSSIGQGSTFAFTLPIALRQDNAQRHPRPS